MTATNHVVTGAFIVASLPYPAVALPLAFLSHFVLDALPHYGAPNHTNRKFLYILAVDVGLSASVLITLFFLQGSDWLWLIAGGILAASPDLLWLPYWLKELRGKPQALGRLVRVLSGIQRYERPWGIYFEVVWFVMLIILLLRATARAI